MDAGVPWWAWLGVIAVAIGIIAPVIIFFILGAIDLDNAEKNIED